MLDCLHPFINFINQREVIKLMLGGHRPNAEPTPKCSSENYIQLKCFLLNK